MVLLVSPVSVVPLVSLVPLVPLAPLVPLVSFVPVVPVVLVQNSAAAMPGPVTFSSRRQLVYRFWSWHLDQQGVFFSSPERASTAKEIRGIASGISMECMGIAATAECVKPGSETTLLPGALGQRADGPMCLGRKHQTMSICNRSGPENGPRVQCAWGTSVHRSICQRSLKCWQKHCVGITGFISRFDAGTLPVADLRSGVGMGSRGRSRWRVGGGTTLRRKYHDALTRVAKQLSPFFAAS